MVRRCLELAEEDAPKLPLPENVLAHSQTGMWQEEAIKSGLRRPIVTYEMRVARCEKICRLGRSREGGRQRKMRKSGKMRTNK